MAEQMDDPERDNRRRRFGAFIGPLVMKVAPKVETAGMIYNSIIIGDQVAQQWTQGNIGACILGSLAIVPMAFRIYRDIRTAVDPAYQVQLQNRPITRRRFEDFAEAFTLLMTTGLMMDFSVNQFENQNVLMGVTNFAGAGVTSGRAAVDAYDLIWPN